MSGFGNTPRGADSLPLPNVFVPGSANPTVLRGSPNTNTDGNNNTTTAVAAALDASLFTSGTLQNAQTGNANGTPLPVLGYGSIIFTVNMSGFTGTVNFEGSEDGTNYDPLLCTQQGTTTTLTTVNGNTTTSIHLYGAGCSGLQSIRARTSGVSAGNVTVTAHAIPQTSSGSGGTMLTDDTTFTAAITSFTPVGGIYNDSIANATAGKADAARLTQKRALHINLRDSSGNELLGSKTSANSAPVVIASDQAAIPIQHGNVVDAGNSSTTTLTANSIFTGTSISSLNYSALSIEVFADQASAAGGLSIQQSQNGTNWDIADPFTISAGTPFNTIVNLVGQFYRVVYTNGSTNQGTFRLQTVKMVADPVLPRTLTAAGALRVDGSGVNQPVSQQASGSVSGVLQNAATANGNGNTLSVLGMGTATFTVTGTNVSTFVATVNFQGSEDGINFYALTVTPSNSSTGVTSTTTTGIFTVGVAGLQLIRATVSGYSSGTITVTAHAVPAASSGGGGGGGGSNASVSTTASAVPGSATYVGGNKAGNLVGFSLDGSGNLNVNVAAGGGSGGTSSTFGAAFPGTGTAIGASDGTNMQGLLVESSSNKNLRVGIYSGANEATVDSSGNLQIKGGFTEVASLSAGSLNADLVASRDVSASKLWSLEVTGTWSGTLTFQGSNDNVSFFSVPAFSVSTGATNTTTGNDLFYGFCYFRYLRVRMTSYTSGTANGTLELYTQPPAYFPMSMNAFITGGSLGLNAGANTIGAVTQASGPWTQNLTQVGSTNIVTGGASGLIAVGGPVASGASNADNPLKVGGVFNTTQPTVTNGQIVDAQYTARGAALVATGVDTFNVTINAALPAGSNTIGAVTQASGPWTANVTQFGSNNVATGTGASGNGIPRMTVSNDSQVQLWDGTTGPAAVEPANESPDLTDKALVIAVSPNNSGLPVNLPQIVQKTNNVTGSAGKTLTITFGSNTVKGNSIIVALGMGEVEIGGGSPITLAVTDSQSNTYTEAVKASQSTTQEAAIFYATNIAGGADTITITIAGSGSSNTAIAAEIYELSGLIAVAPNTLDQTATGSNAGSTSVSVGSMTPLVPNEYAFLAIAAGGGTITAGTNWTLDSGTLSPTGGNLVSFGSESLLTSTIASMTPSATLSASNAWAAAHAIFKTVILPIEGSVNLAQVGSAAIALGQAAMASSIPVAIANNQSNVPTNTVQLNGTTIDTNSGNKSAGTQRVVLATDQPALTNALPVSQSGTWTVQPGNTANTTAWLVQDVAATSGGSTASHTMSAASTNATSLKASAGMVYGLSISNANAAARYFKLYNKASSPTVGTDTPVLTLQVPGNGTVLRAYPVGLVLGTGIAWAATTGIADSDTGAVGANDLSIDIDYK